MTNSASSQFSKLDTAFKEIEQVIQGSTQDDLRNNLTQKMHEKGLYPSKVLCEEFQLWLLTMHCLNMIELSRKENTYVQFGDSSLSINDDLVMQVKKAISFVKDC